VAKSNQAKRRNQQQRAQQRRAEKRRERDRKPHQHLPKSGTPASDDYVLHRSRSDVVDFGLLRGRRTKAIIGGIIVALVVLSLVGWIFITA
jgi:hypothetical protein